eukprot:gnl/TRDRNA2_/TRDRNA2_171706_c1_seq1.p1 gnl/TRDRNA2_/TRDRNA2_171706_c1~~gnl/TRDRNA2_/TRDRNA2_171706_c1_seq1.p1  ORF type:complete len:682 (+),score=93.08 gnl/TRDRNA2_/TRDRNA2_171706_c1_seq1:303-2048(+)
MSRAPIDEDHVVWGVAGDQVSVPDTNYSCTFDVAFPSPHCARAKNRDDQVSIPETDYSYMFCRHMRSSLPASSMPDHGMDQCIESPESPEDGSCHQSWAVVVEKGFAKLKLSAAPPASLPSLDQAIATENFDEFNMVWPTVQMPLRLCAACSSEDPNGWEDSKSRFWCARCWKEYQASRLQKEPWTSGQVTAMQGCVDAEPLRFEHLDPIGSEGHAHRHTTSVVVVDASCLTIAELLSSFSVSSCVVAMGSTLFIMPPGVKQSHKGFPLASLIKSTTIQQAAVQKGSEEGLPLPKWGGLYMPKVNVFLNASGEGVEPFQIPTVYATAPYGPTAEPDDADRYRSELRVKILNILRICHMHGHEDLIISSRFTGAPVGEVAAIFREVLLEVGDAACAFRRVIFALPISECPAKVFLAFQHQFPAANSKFHAPPHPSISVSDRRITLAARPHLGLDADMGAEHKHWNGIKVRLWQNVYYCDREHETWRQEECGRIVLVAFPQLCLSAEGSGPGSTVHVWERVKSHNKDKQIWQAGPNGTIVLAAHPHLCLTADLTDVDVKEKGIRVYLEECASSAREDQVWLQA